MERVIEGYLAAAAPASVASVARKKNGYAGTPKIHELDSSDEGVRNLEHAARIELLKRARALRTSASGPRASASFGLTAVFRSLGASGQTTALRIEHLHKALLGIWNEDVQSISFPPTTEVAATVAARKLTEQVAGADLQTGCIDYRRFEDWLLSPPGFTELRGALIKTVAEASPPGLTGTELIRQVREAADDGSRVDGIFKGNQRLGSFGVQWTGNESNELVSGAVSSGGENDDRVQLTLEMMSREEGNSSDRSDDARGSTRVEMLAASSVDPRAPNSRPPPDHAANQTLEQRHNLVVRDRNGRECVASDSLERMASPPMSVPGLAARVEGAGVSRDTAMISSAATVGAFSRAAVDVQEALSTVVPTGEKPREGNESVTCGGRGEARDHGSDAHLNANPISKPAADNRGRDAKTRGDGEAWRTQSDLSPFPFTSTTTPPLGSARSPTERLRPTRACEERLQAALENLEHAEHPETIVGRSKQSNASRLTTSVGEHEPVSSKGRSSSSQRDSSRSTRRSSARRDSASSPAGRVVSIELSDGACVTASWPSPVSRKGQANLDRGRIARVGSEAAGAEKKCLKGDPRVGCSMIERGVRLNGAGIAGHEKRHEGRGGCQSDAADSDDFFGDFEDGSRDVRDVIGRLRARVAELELTEQLLRCELEGTRADLAANARRAAAAAEDAAGKAKERESALKAKMRARLRAAEAEAAVAQRRVVELKRSSAAKAAERERSTAEYLRRRFKEMEAGLEAKNARRLAKQQKHTGESCWRCRKRCGGQESADFGVDVAGAGITSRARGPQARGRAPRTSPSEERAEGPSVATVEVEGVVPTTVMVHEELRSCRRTNVAFDTSEVSRFHAQAAAASTASRRLEQQNEEGLQGGGRENGGQRAMPSRRKKATTAVEKGDPCSMCRGERNRIRGDRAIMSSSLKRQRMLEQRLAESEDSRIGAQVEAGRLQAFFDEMTGPGSFTVR